jgi:hypothetical protein
MDDDTRYVELAIRMAFVLADRHHSRLPPLRGVPSTIARTCGLVDSPGIDDVVDAACATLETMGLADITRAEPARGGNVVYTVEIR